MRRIMRTIGIAVLQVVPIVLFASFLIFLLMFLVPGDIAYSLAGESATVQQLEEIRALYGLDRPMYEQYFSWLANALQGDLSRSLLSSVPVFDSLVARLPTTLTIVIYAMIISFAVGLPVGVWAASRPGSLADSIVTTLASMGVALPNFWLGMILVTVLGLGMGWFPVSGMSTELDSFSRLIWEATLPAVALGASGVSEIARQTRSALLEFRTSAHMRTLQAKGLSGAAIYWKHGIKNISITLLTVAGLLFNRLLGGTVVVEAVFAIPGLGSLVVAAATGKDFPVMQGVMLVMVLIVILVNFVIDLLYRLVDPRVAKS